MPIGESAPPHVHAREERQLGAILRKQTSLTAAQLEEALEEQRREPRKEGGRVGEILVRLRYVTEEQVLAALGTQLGLKVQPELKSEDVDPALVEVIPINFAKARKLLPLKSNGQSAQVAMADPLDVNAIDDV